MYAVIETGGKQYRVSEGDVITVEKLKGDTQDGVVFDKVLLVSEADNLEVGTPYLEAARVFGQVTDSGKGKKVIIFKYKAKKDYRKKQGHRQPYTTVQIEKISVDGKPEKKTSPAKKEAAIAAEAVEAAEIKEAPVSETAAPEVKPAVEKKPVAKKPAAAGDAAEKKPAAKKVAAEKPEGEKKPAARKTSAKKADEPTEAVTKPEQE